MVLGAPSLTGANSPGESIDDLLYLEQLFAVNGGEVKAATRRGGELGVYQRRILPRLIHFGMRQKQLLPLRERLVADVRGRVLEVGIGSGLNLPFYPREVEILLGLDPSRELLEMARRHASWVHVPVELSEANAGDGPR